jgi:hypothetical protein
MTFSHRNIISSAGRFAAGLAIALLSVLVLASSAFGDAADVKIPPNQQPTISATAVENLGDGHAGTPGDPHTVTVTVTGGWSWPTHGNDCNSDRAGTGVAVAWFDPQQQGNPLGNTDLTAATVLIGGVPTPIFVGVKTANSLNPVDNVVHPTENDIGTGAVADIATPADFANWRGGCGVFSNDTLLDGSMATVSHGNFGKAAAGDPGFTTPTPPAANAAQQGALLTHTYASKADVKRVCAVTYDVHGDGSGKKAGAAGQNGVGIPGAEKPVTAGGSGRNDDNGVEKNANTPLGNACPAFFFPSISTQAGLPTTFAPDGTATISDTATLSGADPAGGGNLVFKAYGPQADPNNYVCTAGLGGNLIGTTTVPVSQLAGDINHDYPASIPLPAAATSGDYVFTVEYQPTVGNTTAISDCNSDRAHETATVNKRTTTLTTDAGSRIGFDPVNGNDLTDIATLSGGTSDGTGTITFKLFKDDGAGGCAAQVGADVTQAVNNGADGQQYTSPSVHVTDAGQYHWTASYDGDGKNSGSSAACGDLNENPKLIPSGIHVVKSGDDHVYHGDTMHFGYVVTNAGGGPLSNVVVSDDKCPNVQGPSKVEGPNDTGAAFLDVGDVWTYTCETPVPAHSAGEENPIVNTVTAAAQDEFQRPVSDTDQHSTRILHPEIAIDKTGPATATEGDLVPYILTVTNPGDESFAAATVVVTDPQCAAAPALSVKNRGAGLDPSPGTLDPGDSWVYLCSVQTQVGQTRVDNVADVNAADEFGHPVSATDTASTVLGQIVQLPQVTPGSARLAGASGCVARKFVASVRGKSIRKVVFSIDGKRRASVSKPDSNGRYKYVVNPRKFSRGSHLLVAKATFDPDSGTKPKTMRLRFSRCVRRAAPAFTG